MLKHIIYQKRPTPETSWFVVSAEFELFREENFVSTGKIISKDEVLSDDQLARVVTTIFLDTDTYTEFTTAPKTVEMMAQRGIYNKTNQIQTRGEMQII
jgi:hypothetical protein